MYKSIFLAIIMSVLVVGFGATEYAYSIFDIGSSGDDGVKAESVPPWIKTSVKFWMDGHVSDSEFLSAVEFLANEKIIRITEPVPETQSTEIEHARYNLQLGGNAQAHPDSFFDIFFATYTADSFFDIFTELQETNREQQSSIDSFFDIFTELTLETDQNTKNIAQLERKIAELEGKIAELEIETTVSGGY